MFPLRGITYNVRKVAEEYYWAITQVAERSCYGRLCSSGLELRFQLDSFPTHTHNQFCTETVQMTHTNFSLFVHSVQTFAQCDLHNAFCNLAIG